MCHCGPELLDLLTWSGNKQRGKHNNLVSIRIVERIVFKKIVNAKSVRSRGWSVGVSCTCVIAAECLHNLRRVCTTTATSAQPSTTCTTWERFVQRCTFCRIFAQPAEVVGAMCTHGLVMIGATSLSILSAPPPPCHRRRGRPPPLLHELFKDAWLVDMWSKFRNICNCHLDKSAVQTMHLKPDC